MENKRKLSETVAEMLGETEVQRGVKLGILAGGLALFLLFGSEALLQKSGEADVVNFDQGRFAALIVTLLAGLVALLMALILAYYSGLSAPEAKSGEAGRSGLLSGGIIMLLYWVGQTVYALVSGARAPQGLQLDSFLRTRLIAGVGFFVVGGLFGWWGCRAAARRSRSILSRPGSSLLSLETPKSTLASMPLQSALPTPTAAQEGPTAPSEGLTDEQDSALGEMDGEQPPGEREEAG